MKASLSLSDFPYVVGFLARLMYPWLLWAWAGLRTPFPYIKNNRLTFFNGKCYLPIGLVTPFQVLPSHLPSPTFVTGSLTVI